MPNTIAPLYWNRVGSNPYCLEANTIVGKFILVPSITQDRWTLYLQTNPTSIHSQREITSDEDVQMLTELAEKWHIEFLTKYQHVFFDMIGLR